MEKKLAEYRAKKAREDASPHNPWFRLNPFKSKDSESSHVKVNIVLGNAIQRAFFQLSSGIKILCMYNQIM